MANRINPLPIIAAWLNEFPYHDCSNMSRADLITWLNRRFPNTEPVAVDCLIAAGIGCEEQQAQTVYCVASYL